MRMRMVVFFWSLLIFIAAHAFGQVPNRLDDVKYVASTCPGLIVQDHAFTDALVMYLRGKYPDENWGRNGKRGNPNDPSHDAVFYPTNSSPFGGAVIDVIEAAGSSQAAPSWQDVTQATINNRTIGVWVEPSGAFPTCLKQSNQPPPVIVPPPTYDTTEILVALSRIENRLILLENQMGHDDLAMITDYVDDMVGDGPTGELVPHVTDLKQRLDVIRVTLEQLNAWLRGRSLLRY